MEVNPLDPKLIPKYTQELVIPPSFLPTICTSPVSGTVSYNYTVTMNQFKQQILPPEFNPTTVWGYVEQSRILQLERKLNFKMPWANF